MKIIVWVGIIFVVGSGVGILLATIFDCVPVEKIWNPLLPGSCLKAESLPYASGALNLLTDMYVLIVPLCKIYTLNMDPARKLRLSILFGLAILAVACSATRLGMTSILYTNDDRFWNSTIISWFA